MDVRKLGRSILTLVGPLLLALLVNSFAFAENIIRRGPAILVVQTRADTSFTPWCARYSYLCVGRPDAPFSKVSTTFDPATDQSLPGRGPVVSTVLQRAVNFEH